MHYRRNTKLNLFCILNELPCNRFFFRKVRIPAREESEGSVKIVGRRWQNRLKVDTATRTTKMSNARVSTIFFCVLQCKLKNIIAVMSAAEYMSLVCLGVMVYVIGYMIVPEQNFKVVLWRKSHISYPSHIRTWIKGLFEATTSLHDEVHASV